MVIFTVECFSAIIAKGLWQHDEAYLKVRQNVWMFENWDFYEMLFSYFYQMFGNWDLYQMLDRRTRGTSSTSPLSWSASSTSSCQRCRSVWYILWHVCEHKLLHQKCFHDWRLSMHFTLSKFIFLSTMQVGEHKLLHHKCFHAFHTFKLYISPTRPEKFIQLESSRLSHFNFHLTWKVSLVGRFHTFF